MNKWRRSQAWRPTFTRSVYAETLLEDFFVAAIGAVLAVRFYLEITDYPSIQIGGLHLAHVLFGGLLMLAGLIIALAFLDRAAKEVAAVAGGAGFGLFIDELGKLITSDNDYFYEPAVALIYVIFVFLFLSIRFVARRQPLSSEECFANAFEIAEQATITAVDPHEAQTAFRLLARCGEKKAAVENLKAILSQMAPASSSRRPLLTRLKKWVDRLYEAMARQWWFGGAVIGFFTLVSVTPLYTLVALVRWSWALALWAAGGGLVLAGLFRSRRSQARRLNVLASAAIVVFSILITWTILASLKQGPLSLFDWARLLFPTISGSIVVIGLLLIPVSRLRAYRMFQRAVLVSIFFTQVLSFYQFQFLALVGLLANIAILLALRYLIADEEDRVRLY